MVLSPSLMSSTPATPAPADAPAFLFGDSYLSLPVDPHPWLITDLIPSGGLTNVFGQPKTGKSFAAIGMAIAVSTGAPDWLGFRVQKHGPVAYLQIDTPRSYWHSRLDAIREGGYDISKIAFSDMMMAPYPFNILDAGHTVWLQKQLAVLKPVMVVVDTLREAHGGDENDSTCMRNVVTNLVAACRSGDHQAALVLVSHGRKSTGLGGLGGDDLMSEQRGSSYVAGRMDAVVKFTSGAMTYKGRSAGEGRITIMQNDIGMVQMDPRAEAYHAFLNQRIPELRSEDPKMSISAMATILAKDEKAQKKSRAMWDDIEHYLISMGLPLHKQAGHGKPRKK